MNERAWNRLLRRIADGLCTPFIGAAASLPVLRQGSEIALDWAEKHDCSRTGTISPASPSTPAMVGT
ncbi:MAG: hypothetical protein LC685_05390 [Actinobacteria bacterium]|nr:hypothetical protein [Actinomycetota bacterium]